MEIFRLLKVNTYKKSEDFPTIFQENELNFLFINCYISSISYFKYASTILFTKLSYFAITVTTW